MKMLVLKIIWYYRDKSKQRDLFFFFFNDTAPTEFYPLSLHDALPISRSARPALCRCQVTPSWRQRSSDSGRPETSGNRITPSSATAARGRRARVPPPDASSRSADRKSTRLNSSHGYISYAAFCLNINI